MNTINNIIEAFDNFTGRLYDTLSGVVPGILLILLSFLAAYLISFLIRVFLNMIKLNKWVENTNMIQVLRAVGLEPRTHIVISKLAFWVIFLGLVEAVASASNWVSISGKFREYLFLIPLLLGAVIIIIAGLYLSRFIRNSAHTILSKASPGTAMILSNSIFYILMAITLTVALNYMGVDTGIITTNISIILGSVLLAFSLAFVFASRDVLTNILSSSYNKKNFEVGQKVRIDDYEGEIIKITNISVFLKTSSKIQIIPARRFTEGVVEILG